MYDNNVKVVQPKNAKMGDPSVFRHMMICLCQGLTVHFRQSFEVSMHETEKKRLTLEYNTTKVHGSKAKSTSKIPGTMCFFYSKDTLERKKRVTIRGCFSPTHSYPFLFNTTPPCILWLKAVLS